MITFHSQQSDCARRPRKNENAATFNFTSQIAPSICAVMFTKRANTMQPFSSHGAVARLCATALIGCKPYPLTL